MKDYSDLIKRLETMHPAACPDLQDAWDAAQALREAGGAGDTTILLGIKAMHRIVTDGCRGRGGEELAEVLAETAVALGELYKNWPQGQGAKFNVVVTVEYPDHPPRNK